eukprot:CAMPEP_0168592320 /NCGR_PEP_ID=MMETSP0420-20121227/7664_1 /TAXON_ID=498008 /ORGANISM="Pessonella sp." /LENGTH=130 /DNA_ID=CAMNT_0008628289 /DNA_START=456 /DNA_END=845 /DNA_ORIENTATION=+
MSSAAHIGLNETKLGIIAPPNIFGLPFQRAVGARQAERLLQTGAVLSPREALDVGLIDYVVESEEELLNKAVDVLKVYQSIPAGARVQQKMLARGSLIEKLQRERNDDLKQVLALLMSDDVQRNLTAYVS